MSADNGIYILKSKDGYRVIHAQAIENIYWWWNDLRLHLPGEAEKLEQKSEYQGNIYAKIGGGQKNILNPLELYCYFKDGYFFNNLEEAEKKADELDQEEEKFFGFSTEYGIHKIIWDEIFPLFWLDAYAMAQKVLK